MGAVKQNEAELLRLIGQRQTDPAKAFQALKASFELYQKVLTVISKDTAPNHWALLCAELGHTIVAALPLLGEDDQKRMGGHAVAAFEAARASISSPAASGRTSRSSTAPFRSPAPRPARLHPLPNSERPAQPPPPRNCQSRYTRAAVP